MHKFSSCGIELNSEATDIHIFNLKNLPMLGGIDGSLLRVGISHVTWLLPGIMVFVTWVFTPFVKTHFTFRLALLGIVTSQTRNDNCQQEDKCVRVIKF